ncbi:unnamed protein product [Prorocentrum cordatum]|uniref:Uncharacterized protein n=1 Tax=Prorocentrum cordatum TaxID=2364126 RepID=A0ABN9TW04_9DINO|nr:unnamed protein product [Polarella glacialis]
MVVGGGLCLWVSRSPRREHQTVTGVPVSSCSTHDGSDEQPDLVPDAQSDEQPDKQPDLQSDRVPDVKADEQPDLWSFLSPDAQPHAFADCGPDEQPDKQPDLQSDRVPDVGPTSSLTSGPSSFFPGSVVTSSAFGDPHMKNAFGERFDLMAPGNHVLINIPRGERAEENLLRVQADARRLGKQCTVPCFQDLNVTGSWAEAEQAGDFSSQRIAERGRGS